MYECCWLEYGGRCFVCDGIGYGSGCDAGYGDVPWDGGDGSAGMHADAEKCGGGERDGDGLYDGSDDGGVVDCGGGNGGGGFYGL